MCMRILSECVMLHCSPPNIVVCIKINKKLVRNKYVLHLGGVGEILKWASRSCSKQCRCSVLVAAVMTTQYSQRLEAFSTSCLQVGFTEKGYKCREKKKKKNWKNMRSVCCICLKSMTCLSVSNWLPWVGQNPEIRPLVDQDTETLQRMLPEIPLWVKNPDYDRVSN